MTRYSRYSLAALAALLIAPAAFTDNATAEQASDPHAKHRAMMKQSQADISTASDIKLRDEVLLDQHGTKVRFVSDVIGDQIVVMDFVYTTCTTVCPVLSAIFQQVQTKLGDRLGIDVKMISMSVDPVRDTPERMNKYAQGLRAHADWTWLTGEKTTVDEVLRGLGAYTPNFEDHPSIVLVGDPQRGTWKRFFGFPGPDKILAAVDAMTAARQHANAGH